ncbi:unnamed protein product [Gemmata massiliana]|uniref:Lipoprotein n=1 Tax=Gemmata massiliana TaxID=1210884 RepID=A0A6P2DK34_9BACT|nr:hypothetical protein [Gemmata massiliana]VTS03680.1 unnamed protein product [Gemmata massiliana]
MNTKRFLLTLTAFVFLLPLSGCGCHRHGCGDDRRSFAPPPSGCCDKNPPPNFLPDTRPY